MLSPPREDVTPQADVTPQEDVISPEGVITSASTATSRLTPGLIIPDSMTMKISRCGKGLYATRVIEAETTLFTEKPFIWVPAVEQLESILKGSRCGYCGKEFGSMGKTIRVNCKRCSQGAFPPFPFPL